MAYKVFTNGSTLQASEVNDNLMKQAVATFSNAAARTAAITSPVEGQMTYLLDVDLYQHWNGSAWVSPFGLTLVAQQTIGSSVSTITFSNVFSAEYDDYKIIYTGGTAISGGYVGVRLGLNGTPATSADYKTAFVQVSYTTSAVTGAGSTTSSFEYAGRHSSTFVDLAIDLRSPFLVQQTRMSGTFSQFAGAATVGGVHEVATSYNDLIILGNSFTGGRVSVFGYKKA